MQLCGGPDGSLFDVEAHEQAGLEHHDPLRRHRDFLTGLRIAAAARCALADLEHPEVAQLDRLPVLQALHQIGQRPVDHALDIHLRDAGFFGDRYY